MEWQSRKINSGDAGFLYFAVCDLEQSRLPEDRFQSSFRKALQSFPLQYYIVEEGGVPKGYFALRIENQLHHCGPMAEIVEFYHHTR